MSSPNQKYRFQSLIASFLDSEAGGGLVLMAVAVIALIVANSPFAEAYFQTLHIYIGGLSVLHWINDALMAVFFLLVGLEIKREVLTGELATWSQRALPGIAACGGVIVPALVYLLINLSSPASLKGWAIPAATDIAFALGVLALLGSRVPTSLKIFLTALAIIDDLAAVIIIALFYTAELNLVMLGAAFLGLLCLFMLNRLKVKAIWVFLLIGGVIWFFTLKSGIHATLAGVAVALFIPMKTHQTKGHDDHHSPLVRLEHALHKPVAFLIVPIFGFANAGVALGNFTPEALLDPVPLGVALGLFLGKQVGVFTASALAIKLGLAKMPKDTSWMQLYGLAVLTGIGFTMSLFIGGLAFAGAPVLQDEVKIGVLLGSTLSGIIGYLLLRIVKVPTVASD
jgi:Na+:H+ antiporter, NhaA family